MAHWEIIRLYSEYIDKGNGAKYPDIVVNWAGGVPTTIRVDGFENVDVYACNAMEIIAPSSCWLGEEELPFTNMRNAFTK